MELIEAKSIFSPATGFIARGGFDWTCNPYVGCTFGCTYCYAMFLPQNDRPKDDWGKWFRAKKNAIELVMKQGKEVAGQSIYMSSVTDPYLPAERGLQLTRGLLEALVPHAPRLVVQTRGPLVVRDIDVLSQFASLRVNMSIPTDSETVRKLFEPKAPTLAARWKAAAELRVSGIAIGLCVTPTLPIEDPERFAETLIEFNPEVLVLQEFHSKPTGFGADTGAKARQLTMDLKWTADKYRDLFELLAMRRMVFEGEAGFFPPGP